jgi:ubiquinone biosynthesis protein Coq4
MGLEAKPLFAQRWKEGWARPLQECREALQLRPFAGRVGRV